jgi:Ca2+:H+ antiporter
MANAPATTPGNALPLLTRSQRIILAVAIELSVLAGVLTFRHANAVLIFILSGVALAAILGAVIVFDGESNWLEGLALIGLYVITAVSFWWG